LNQKKRMSLKKRNINISIVIECRRVFLLEDVIIQVIIDQSLIPYLVTLQVEYLINDQTTIMIMKNI